jgi:hypothetical protein
MQFKKHFVTFAVSALLMSACGSSRPGNPAGYEGNSRKCSQQLFMDLGLMTLAHNIDEAGEAVGKKYAGVDCEIGDKRFNVDNMIGQLVSEFKAKRGQGGAGGNIGAGNIGAGNMGAPAHFGNPQGDADAFGFDDGQRFDGAAFNHAPLGW